MQIHQLQRNTARKMPKRVGRAGGRGKTSGRGHKGQGQHGSHGIRPDVRDAIKKLPKLRGYKFNPLTPSKMAVNVALLQEICTAGTVVTPQFLFDKGIIKNKKGLRDGVKILGNGEISIKVTIQGCAISKTAAEKILNAGGEIIAK